MRPHDIYNIARLLCCSVLSIASQGLYDALNIQRYLNTMYTYFSFEWSLFKSQVQPGTLSMLPYNQLQCTVSRCFKQYTDRIND